MAENTGIQWTDHTWNPWHGCAKLSPGCDHCYMFRDKLRYGQDPEVVQRSKTTFNAPLKFASGPGRVFTCSWSDWFIHDADAWRDDAWHIIKQRPDLNFQILTKRHGRIASHLPPDWGDGWDNVWLGVSVENQEWMRRADVLRKVPAKTRFLSIEPQIGPIDLRGRLEGIHWVIVGGESGGKEARPFDIAWARDIIAACAEANVACFIKQLGRHPFGFDTPAQSVAIRDTHAGNWDEWPADLRVREFPCDVSLLK